MGPYGEKVAKKIIGKRICEFDVSEDGISPRLVSVENAEFDQLINWSPLCEQDDDDGPDPEIAPALPFPFAANHLAAWMLHGGGYFVREQYGDWADGPDAQAISELGIQATKAKQALKKAFDAYRTAANIVGPYDTTYSEKIQELEKQYGSWPDAQEARKRIKQAHCDADAYEAAWRKKMVNQLLAVEELPLDEEQTLPTPAPVVAASDATPDPERRLAALRALGGAAKYKNCEWSFTFITKLADSEKRAGRTRSDVKTIRCDLKEAAQAERDEKSAGHFDGMGQR